jgi:hypothetical protein
MCELTNSLLAHAFSGQQPGHRGIVVISGRTGGPCWARGRKAKELLREQRRLRLSTEGVSGLRCPTTTSVRRGGVSTWLTKGVNDEISMRDSAASLCKRSLTVLGARRCWKFGDKETTGRETEKEGRKIPEAEGVLR